MDEELLRNRLGHIHKKTKESKNLPPPGWWIGDAAGKRQVIDDLRAGRLAWQAAHRDAGHGLEAIESGDLPLAQSLAWAATDFYITALEAEWRRHQKHLPATARNALNTPAQRRGRRKPKPEND